MTADEYKEFVAQVNSGALLIGVDRAIARKFYTDIPLSKIEEETGEAPYFEKMVVWFAFLSAPIAFLASLVLSVLALRWWAAVAIPFFILAYFVFSGQSSMARRGMLSISILLALAVGSLFARFSSQIVCWYRLVADGGRPPAPLAGGRARAAPPGNDRRGLVTASGAGEAVPRSQEGREPPPATSACRARRPARRRCRCRRPDPRESGRCNCRSRKSSDLP